jgi:putative peptide zinc metalloprotease protein
MRRIALVLVTAALLFAVAGAGATPAGGQDNAAVAINTKDGTDIFKLAFKIARVNQEIVDQSNGAVAFNNCEECQSIAVAIQIVLIFSDPDVVSSTNLALAYNYECDACVAFASAYQWLLTTGGPVHLTAEGNARIAAIRRRLHELANSDLTLEQLLAELKEIKAEIADILATELEPAGPPTETSTTTLSTTTAPPTTAPPTTTTAAAATTTTEPTTTSTTGSTTTVP